MHGYEDVVSVVEVAAVSGRVPTNSYNSTEAMGYFQDKNFWLKGIT